MKPLLAAVTCLALGTVAPAFAADRDGERPIRPVSQCLRIDQINDWKVIDDRQLLVKSLGSRYYDIRLQRSCRRLVGASWVSFRDGVQPLLNPSRPAGHAPAQNPSTTDGRICGDIGDAVIPRDGGIDMTQTPCDIVSIQRIDAEQWKAKTHP